MKISEDETLFAWESAEFGADDLSKDVLASDPKDFSEARDLIPFASDGPVVPYTMTHRGLRIWLALFNIQQLGNDDLQAIRPLRSPVMIWSGNDSVWAVLRCHVIHDFHHFVIIPLRHLAADIYLRDTSTSVSLIPTGSLPTSTSTKEVYIRNSRIPTIWNSIRRRFGFLLRNLPEGFQIHRCYPKEAWDDKDKILQGKREDSGSPSWDASLQLDCSLATKGGLVAGCMIFLALGCRQGGSQEQPRAWCHVDDKIWRYGTANLETFHHSVTSKPPRYEVQRFRAGNITRLDLNLKVSIVPKKVFLQDMFVVDIHYSELDANLGVPERPMREQLLSPGESLQGSSKKDSWVPILTGKDASKESGAHEKDRTPALQAHDASRDSPSPTPRP
jgi:hypothetical protein